MTEPHGGAGTAAGTGAASSGGASGTNSGGTTATGGTTGNCTLGQIACAGQCVDPATNAAHCGACGNACALGSQCANGVCGSCQAGLTSCGAACVDPRQDPLHCGACGTACALGQSCASGSCSCPTGSIACAGACVDPMTNAANCGACGAACAQGQVCSTGTCQCLPGLTVCNGACVNVASDAINCGSCGNACPTGQVCSQGACATTCATNLTLCGSSCVDVSSDNLNCGACGTACPSGQGCSNRACSCPSGQTACGSSCVSTTSDPANCGACGRSCAAGQTCAGGQCACPSGQALCGSQCTSTSNNPQHCGACGNACSGGRACSGTSCVCPSGQTFCNDACVSTGSDTANCGSCGNRCTTGATCNSGTCSSGQGGQGGTGGTTGGGGSGGTGGTTGGACTPGTTTTNWATSCPTTGTTCTAGSWTAWGSSSPENYPFRYETAHFAFYWPDGRNVTLQQAQAAGDFLENVVWRTYLGSPIFWPEPYCNTANKLKTSIHIIESGLFGGCNAGRPGIWVGPGALGDHWGLGHEWMHALQCLTPGFQDCGAGGCWIHESHANFMPHQLPEYRTDTHCSDLLVNMPHLYYGSTRDRYCNWQFFEFLKDKHCYKAVNDMWTSTAPAGQRDPMNKLALGMGWNAEQLNDVFGEWAMHNITWDYKDPPPTSGGNQGATYRSRYGAITDKSRPERRLRLTALEPLNGEWATTRRFASPNLWAPQRFGYNVVRLFPDAGATSVSVTFRGVTQSGANSGWRWGLVATDAGLTTSRYSPLQRGTDGRLDFCINAGESVWLVVVATPTAIQKVIWDQPFPSIYRYPYMVEFGRAWPEGFRNGQQDACPSGTQRHSNGGGCALPGLAASVFVGPYAQVLGGNVSGNARIEDHAVILNGATVSGGTVTGLSILNRFSVSGTARVETTFLPPGYFETGQGLSGSAWLFGDVEYRGPGLNRSSGSFYGFVDSATASATINDVTVKPPYTWRP